MISRSRSIETHHDALGFMKRFGFSVYDSLIIAAAARARCETLYSEDMQDGQKIGANLTNRQSV
jgi:predicted nucleic acid-binding protein